VYVQELPSGVHTITGVATSVGAFVDFFTRGPLNTPVQVFSWADVVANFGPISDLSEASFALDQFFRNGGSSAWVVRVTNAATPAAVANVSTLDAPGGAAAVTFAAPSPGAWGNSVRVRVEPTHGAATFDVFAREVRIDNGREQVVQEVAFRGLSATPADVNYVTSVVNQHENDSPPPPIVVSAATSVAPASSGYVTAALTPFPAALNVAGPKPLTVTLDGPGLPTDARDIDLGNAAIGNPAELAARLEAAIRSAPTVSTTLPASRVEFTAATAKPVGLALDQVQIVPGVGTEPSVQFTFSENGGTTAADALLDVAARVNIACYGLGAHPGTVVRAQSAATAGGDGNAPAGTDLLGQESMIPLTGMYSLNTVDIFNLLCLPRVAKVSGSTLLANDFPRTQVVPTVSAATDYVRRRRAMLLLDPPNDNETPAEIRKWINDNATLRDPNVAFHYPRLIVADPTNGFRDRSIGASGTIAGLCGRIDTARGVWKAPAGTEAAVRGITRLAYKMTDDENGTLNPIGINALRTFPTYGSVNWGARTTFGEDVRASDWKYVPVRRLALYLEETLFRSTTWVIFEPNDEPLWAQIRLSVGSFMADLFHKGAFAGRTKQDAYFVHCDSTTTTPLDQTRGVVNIVVGFAPLRPAEFLIINIQQIPPALEV
jgi:phage tail sheath protein FI